ncbi:MAG: VacB/RNase II family 3'-5' exoribonuclease [Phycisphaerae bacterium]|nr:VacB/RNase II family 3'-5' exoribonuclease [Phycisphaerae bacterium]
MREPPQNTDWSDAVLSHLANHADHPLKLRPLAKALGVTADAYAGFRDVVRKLVEEGRVVVAAGRTLRLPAAPSSAERTGTLRLNRRGFGFVEILDQEDVFVPRHEINGAMDGDRVVIELIERRAPRRDEPPRRFMAGKRRRIVEDEPAGAIDGEAGAGEDEERGAVRGRVLRVVHRAAYNWVGVVMQRGRRWFLQPSGKSSSSEPIELDDPIAKSVRDGDLVVVEPLPAPRGMAPGRAVVIERLGSPSETQNIITSVIRRYELPEAFTTEVRDAARLAAEAFDADGAVSAEANGDGPAGEEREDLRALTTITIDPPDARDFDDAISIEQLDGGRTRLGVHIADVSWFVRSGSAVDREAYLRGNSVYFPNRVIPMLPEVLSNGVCSLQPEQPRFAISAFLTYDASARVIDERICASVIRSSRRFTYDEVSDYLEGKKLDAPEPVLWLLTAAERLAKRIQRRRRAAGMISLALPEVQLRLDAAEGIVGAQPADTRFSHTLIEMFMVEANEAAARALRRLDVDHVRRVHAPPAPLNLAQSSRLASLTEVDFGSELDHSTIQKITEQARNSPHEASVNYLLLRSLAQAKYSVGLAGHFALASEDYCHFTSPIRRYPDLIIHRLLRAHVIGAARADEDSAGRRGGRGKGKRRHGAEAAERPAPTTLADAARHTSRTERTAQQAEREARTILLLTMLEKRIGEVCDGVVTSVERFGAFVQIQPWLAEGLIPISELRPGFWEVDQTRGALVERSSRRVLRIGHSIRVVIDAVDAQRLELALAPAEDAPIGKVERELPSTRKPGGKRSDKRGGPPKRTSGKPRKGFRKGKRR